MTNKDKISDIDDFQNSNTYNTSDDSDDSKFTDLYTKTMDNVTMSQENKDVIRAKLAEQSQTGRSGRKLIRIGKYSAIAATVCAVLLCIPATRTTVSAAIDYIKQTFHLANGTEVTYEENSEGNSIQFTISTDDVNGYTKVENGRLYLVLGNTKKDITDQCGPDKYFRHEIKNADGSHSVILIGGTPESCGWAELFFDKNGKYVFNNMNVEDYSDPWLNDALHAEGVDTGNPYLDDDLSDTSGSAADAMILILTCVVSCVLFEWLYQKMMNRKVTISDLSAVVTGLLLALNLSPDVPVWMAILGSAFAIIIVKQLFGGLGFNFMNPALGARCFLLISFAGRMTSFSYDGVTTATPLAVLKNTGDLANVNVLNMFLGNIPSCHNLSLIHI